jgi:hypothetical protein
MYLECKFLMVSNWKKLSIVASFWTTIVVTQFFGSNSSVLAADKVVVRFGPFAESISLAELQEAADTGEFPRGWELYTGSISPEQRRLFVEALRVKIPIDVVTLSSLLNTEIGTSILTRLSQALVRKDDAGVQALRAAFVLGARENQGLSLLNFIAAYPSQHLEIDVLQALQVARGLNRYTEKFIDAQRELQSITSQ